MRRNQLNFWIDTAALLAMLGMTATGLVVRYILPAGSGGHGRGAGLTLWGWSRHEWGDIHFWLAVGAIGLLIVHLALHWTWACATARRLVSKTDAPPPRLSLASRTAWGAAFTAVIVAGLGLFTWSAASAVKIENTTASGPDNTRQDNARESESPAPAHTHDIRGYMTLEETAATAGVPMERLRDELGLPATVSGRERLGRLRRDHGVELSAVRNAVKAIQSSEPRSAD